MKNKKFINAKSYMRNFSKEEISKCLEARKVDIFKHSRINTPTSLTSKMSKMFFFPYFGACSRTKTCNGSYFMVLDKLSMRNFKQIFTLTNPEVLTR